MEIRNSEALPTKLAPFPVSIFQFPISIFQFPFSKFDFPVNGREEHNEGNSHS
jgi:hypothetical protein